MAHIKTQGNGNAAVVVLDDHDRLLLSSALTAYAQEKGVSMSAVAKDIGVGRTYLYSLLEANQIELSRLCKIQDLVNFRLVCDSAAYLYASSIYSAITGRPMAESWIENCLSVRLDAFYVLEFLIPAMESEIGAINRMFGLAIDAESALPTFSDEELMVARISSYCSAAINSFGGWSEVHDCFYSEEPLEMEFPVAIDSSLWEDFFEVAHESIYKYYDGFWDDSFDEQEFESISDDDEPDVIERKTSRNEFRRQLKAHEEAEEKIMDVSGRVSEWDQTLAQYCHSNGRVPRKRFYLPLELKNVVDDLESSTLPIAGKTRMS